MTENLTQRFIDHRNVSLTTQTVAEFAFHHAERGFDVRSLVVVRQKFGSGEIGSSETSSPTFRRQFPNVGLQRNKLDDGSNGNRVGDLPRA